VWEGRYGGVVVREAVHSGADWFVHNFADLTSALKRHQVTFIGSGGAPSVLPFTAASMGVDFAQFKSRKPGLPFLVSL
jgi:hypothetical protein